MEEEVAIAAKVALGGRPISGSLGALPDVLRRVSLLLRGSAPPGEKLKECLRLGPVLH